MKQIHLLVINKPGNQHAYPETVLAAEKAFATQKLAADYKSSGGDPRAMEMVTSAEILTLTLIEK
jgi:hypothetical protein